MTFSIKKWLYLLLACFVCSMYGGSYFSSKAKGLGLRTYSIGVRAYGMGNAGLAAYDSLALNNYAISQWRHLANTRMSISFFYNRNTLEIDQENFTSNVGNLFSISAAIPIQRKKWVIGMALQPYTQVDFKNKVSLEGTDTTFTQVNLLSGGINKAQLNLVWSPMPQLGLSLNGNYYFGAIQDRYEFDFPDQDLLGVPHLVRHRFKGPGFGLSMDAQPIKNISFAGFVDFATSAIDVERVYEAATTILEREVDGFDQFPLHYGVGTNIQLNARWHVSADYSAQQWSKSLTVLNDDFDDWSHFGVGFERKLLTKKKAGFLNGMDIRAGYSRTQLGYKFNGEPTHQSAFHFGLGIPFTGRLNRLDFGLEFGTRGDKTKHLASERFINFQISASVGERWFNTFR